MLKTHLQRKIRQARIRKKIAGTAERPRLSIHRSNKYLWIQLIDDTRGQTIFALDDRQLKAGDNLEKARVLGEDLAKRALEAGIKEILFDRSGYKYHGRVAKLAESARAGGLKF